MTSTPSSTIHPDISWIPPRSGPRPSARPRTPHQQLDQNAPPAVQAELWSRMKALPDVHAAPSIISGGTTRGLHLDRAKVNGPREAVAPDGGTEFAHLHEEFDGSLHLNLPQELAAAAISAGWAEFHPIVLAGMWPPSMVMIYGPRNAEEIDIVLEFVRLSRAFAAGPE